MVEAGSFEVHAKKRLDYWEGTDGKNMDVTSDSGLTSMA